MKKLLIVIDYQVDFVSGSLGFARAKELEEGICKRINEYRQSGDEVWFTMDTHKSDYISTREGGLLPVAHCIKGTSGWELYGEVSKLRGNSPLIEKPSFGSVELLHRLEENPFDEVELAGVVTNICVISNAAIIKAALPEADICVNTRLTASNDSELHQKALEVMESFHIRLI